MNEQDRAQMEAEDAKVVITGMRQISQFVFEDAKGGREPLFELTTAGYLHQSGYGIIAFTQK